MVEFLPNAYTHDSFMYDFNISWGDSSSERIEGPFINKIGYNRLISHSYSSPGTYLITVQANSDVGIPKWMGCDFNSVIKDVVQWGTYKWPSFEYFLDSCIGLETISASDAPDLSLATSMDSTFKFSKSFNANINHWNVSTITNMVSTFENCYAFNGSLSEWDVSHVQDMSLMFGNTIAFNQPLSSWDVGNVKKMGGLFYIAISFDQNINQWNVSSVTTMREMFYQAKKFNKPLASWDVSSVTDMHQMLFKAHAFDQNLSLWNVSSVVSYSGTFANAPISLDRSLFPPAWRSDDKVSALT